MYPVSPPPDIDTKPSGPYPQAIGKAEYKGYDPEWYRPWIVLPVSRYARHIPRRKYNARRLR